MDDDSTKTPEQLRQELAELRQTNSELRQQRSVEQAAERIREEVLAMRSPDDFFKVAAEIYRQMVDLGMEPKLVAIALVDEETDFVLLFWAFDNLRKYGITWSERLDNDHRVEEFDDKLTILQRKKPHNVMTKEEITRWQEQKTAYLTRDFPPGHFAHFFTSYGLEVAPEADLSSFEGEWHRTSVAFEYGGIGFYERQFRQEHEAIVQQLTEALSLGYVRFLDFQQLEEQAQILEQQVAQARIERAVERIRAEAMAMRSTDDLLQVGAILFQEIRGLDIDAQHSEIHFIDEKADRVITFLAIENPGTYGVSWTSPDLVAFNDEIAVCKIGDVPVHQARQRTMEVWRQGRTLVVHNAIRIEQMRRFQQAWGFSPMPSQVQLERDARERPSVEVSFDYGVVDIRLRQHREEHTTIIEELTRALSLSYVRFRDLQQAQDALVRSESLAAIGTLAAGAAHELNNPIGAAASLVQTVQEIAQEDSGEEWTADRALIAEHLSFSRKELDRAKTIVASLLDLSRQSQHYTEAVNLQTVAQDALRGLHGHYDTNQVTIEEAYQADLPTVQGNFAQLVQVALNLIDNAVDALGKDKGTVALKTYADGDQVAFECSDTGAGMPDEVRQDIFKPFFTTKAPGDGTGLGLYVCHQIAERHGGTMEVNSAEGQGTTVRVLLPIA